MSIIISNMNMHPGCQKCKFFRKHLFGNGLDYTYFCILGAKDFPMPCIRQLEERASDCPIKPLEQESSAWCTDCKEYDQDEHCCHRFSKVIRDTVEEMKQEPVLDKIRAEIEQAADKQFQIAMGVAGLNERYTHIQMENAYRHSLNVIDKYRTESEE